MQESRFEPVDAAELARNQRLINPTTIRTEGATRKQITKALGDTRNFKVSVFQPGAIVKRKGKKFRVTKSGKLVAA
jgi:hypothetical protein